MYTKCYFPYLIQSLIILGSNKIGIRSHLEIKGNVLLYFLQLVKIFLDPTVFLPQILGRNNLRPHFYGYVFVYAIMLCPHGSRALAIVDLY